MASSWSLNRRLGRLLRVAVVVCAFIVVATVFQAPTVRAADPDTDGDGLTDATEQGLLYFQSAGVMGLPAAIPDSGFQGVYETTSIVPWVGAPALVSARIDFTHYSRTDLVIVVGSWTGSAWDDRVVYDPMGRAPSGIPASITHTHTTTRYNCIDDPWYGLYCWETTTSYTETHAVTMSGIAGQPTLVVGTSYAPTTPGLSSSLPYQSVTVDLLKPAWALTGAELSAGIKAPAFRPDDFRTRGTWRVVVMDFVPGASGSLTSVALRWEGRSNAWNWDSDGDGLGDGTEALHYRSVPLALDSDVDGIRDSDEVWSYWITVSVDGSTYSGWVATDPVRWDTDGDGLGDGHERILQTHPLLADTDYDSLSDGAEVGTYQSNPTRRDTDGDTLSDNVEVYSRTLAVTVNGGTQYRSVTTLPHAEDSDGDGLRDDREWYGTSVYGVRTDPSDADTDDDGLPDGHERYVREISLSTRKTVGTSLWVPLTVWPSGPIERVDVRYGLSTIDASNFYVHVDKDGRYVVLRNRQGSGSVAYGSSEITTAFAHGGTYGLYVWSPVAGGVLEEFALSFTLRTSPILADSDWDGLNDGEEVTYGADAWITDPNRWDTDGDYWSDSYESMSRGTNPLAWDTDGDGARDSADLDPLRNLLVAVRVNRVHHGAGPWCTPELVGVVRVNNDYTWVTAHRMATEDRYWSWGCWADIASTASFYYTYYADVPDDQPWVSVRATAWGINPGRGDDVLVDQYVSYNLWWGAAYYSLWNGNSWYSFDLWTVALPKAKTLLITDGSATVTASNGQVRLTGQDRYFVFTLDATNAYGSLAYGMNTIIVPRSIFLETKLKSDFSTGYHWPLADAPLYGEDLGRADLSEGLASVIAKSLSGWDAYTVLDRLLRNAANAYVYSSVDITSYAVLANLPADVVQILPWAGVSNGPTGAPPADFWQKIGAAMSTVVNALVSAGQLVYKGLVALGTFLRDLGQAIWNWGMRVAGTVSYAVSGAVEGARMLLEKVVDVIIAAVRAAFQALIDGVKGALSLVFGRLANATNDLLYAADGAAPAASSGDFLGRLLGLMLALAELGGLIATISAILMAVEVGLTIAQATGVGFAINLAIQVAIYAAFSVLGEPIQKEIGNAIVDVIAPSLRVGALFLAVVALMFAILSFVSPGAWNTVSEKLVIHTGQGIYVFDVKPKRVWVEYPGSGTSVMLSVLSLAMLGFKPFLDGAGLSKPAHQGLRLAVDTFSLVLASSSVARAFKSQPVPLVFGNVAKLLSVIALGTATASFISDAIAL